VKELWNEYKLKWLCPRIVFSRHTNLQEKLLGDLKRKLMFGIITDKDLGQRPCNCRDAFKVNGERTYGDDALCRMAGIVYKILCNSGKDGKNSTACKSFYIGKSQLYTKTRIQEHW
jgi:hypothetical protein